MAPLPALPAVSRSNLAPPASPGQRKKGESSATLAEVSASSPSSSSSASASLNNRQPNRTQIHIRFVEADGSSSLFKVTNKTKIGKLATTYCDSKKYNEDSVRFLFQGTRVKTTGTAKDKTMEDLGIDDGAVVDVFTVQTGG